MNAEVVVAIHQPNFFPWLGYFDKIVRADRFVLLDTVQFAKTGGTWSNRVRVLSGESAAFVTLPVVRAYHGVRLINEMQIDDRQPWRRKLLQTLKTEYGKAKCFDDVFPEIARLVEFGTESLLEFNRHAIGELCRLMQIEAGGIVPLSTLNVSGLGTDRLIAAVRAAGGSTYLSGDGAEGYQEDHKFEAAGVRLVRQNFQHPVYPQGARPAFVPGLSCIDALMHCGFAGTRALIGAAR
jgi:hypothetical protein